MKILILTPIDPFTIVKTGQDLYADYNKHNDLFSIQAMSLLDNEIHKEGTHPSYITSTSVFAAEMRDNPRLSLSKQRTYDNLIVWGNLDSHTMKFDHIISWEQAWNTETDNYITTLQDRCSEAFEKLKIKPIRWYTKEDVHFIFPTWPHLQLFLKTLGVKTNAV